METTRNKWWQQPEILLGVGVLAVMAMLVIPLPGLVLDSLLAISLTIGLMILLVAMGVTSPSDFSVFPTLLLATTVFRLALNVSTTRLILSQGPAADSFIIDSFASFVVGGGTGNDRLVLGLIIFLILVLVQMMVITKGATRISEVAARFTLDAMPGKQMAVDTELSSGHITQEEASKRRRRIEGEANFYGAMDGAAKFVQGDVRVGLLITTINIFGGLVVGMVFRGESLASALEIYISFTIGDGLASQLPALLITTATGVLVTRSVSDDDVPTELKEQLFQRPGVLWLVSGALLALSLIPGFPTLTLLAFAGLFGYLAYYIQTGQEKQEKESAQTEEGGPTPQTRQPQDYYKDLGVDTLALEVGFQLIELINPQTGGTIVEELNRLRREFVQNMGIVIPPVKIRDNMSLQPDEFQISLMGTPILNAQVDPSRLIAFQTPQVDQEMEGEAYTDPTYGRQAILIPPDQKNEAENRGYEVVAPSVILVVALKELIQQHASELLNRGQLDQLLESLTESHRHLVDDLFQATGNPMPKGDFQKVLRNLIRERVSIRNLPQILETVANNYSVIKDPEVLSELARISLGRQIVTSYMDSDRKLRVIHVDPSILRVLGSGGQGRSAPVTPQQHRDIVEALSGGMQQALQQNLFPVFLVPSQVRQMVFGLLESVHDPKYFAVLADEEVPKNTQVEAVSMVSLEKEEAPAGPQF